jgi:hypothetical protein
MSPLLRMTKPAVLVPSRGVNLSVKPVASSVHTSRGRGQVGAGAAASPAPRSVLVQRQFDRPVEPTSSLIGFPAEPISSPDRPPPSIQPPQTGIQPSVARCSAHRRKSASRIISPKTLGGSNPSPRSVPPFRQIPDRAAGCPDPLTSHDLVRPAEHPPAKVPAPGQPLGRDPVAAPALVRAPGAAAAWSSSP